MNIQLSEKIISRLVQEGVRTFCLCAGARNSPLVAVLSAAKGIEVLHFFDERSAAFFALGMIQNDERPVAVVTTSGTAVAELIPAAVEATYTSLPIVLVTADRPRQYRKTGAPQAIDQVGIFSHYIEVSQDIEGLNEDLNLGQWTQTGPLHLNVCFDEPLLDQEIQDLDLTDLKVEIKNFPNLVSQQKRKLDAPVVIVGPLKKKYRETVIHALAKLGAPIYAEVLSGLRGDSRIAHLLLNGGERIVEKAFQEGWAKSVLRVGGVPTLRFWRDLEGKYNRIPVHSISENDFVGLSRPASHLVGFYNFDLIEIRDGLPVLLENIRSYDQSFSMQLTKLLKESNQSEPSLLQSLAQSLKGKTVYIGNSLPIRELDLVTSVDCQFEDVLGNRGANGIDGQISTFLGFASHHRSDEVWCIVGDLTALYDLNSLWITSKLKFPKLRIVIVNNGGGMIFKNLFGKDEFLNRHQINFEKWAEMFSWPYVRWSQIQADQSLPDRCIIELHPNENSTNQFWVKYRGL